MATVFTVHGTFAHGFTDPSSTRTTSVPTPVGAEKQWWEPGSTFEKELKDLVAAEDGELQFEPVVWNGANSEKSRRAAGKEVVKRANKLEAEGKDYVFVGQSHGGSAISSALLQATAKRKPLDKLSRWISVGTPFVHLRKETFLFSRVPLVLQAIYVSLLLFVVMFMLPMILGLFANEDVRGRYMGGVGMFNLESIDGVATLALTTLIMSSVFLLFYIFLFVMDRRILHMHAPRVIAKTQERFGTRWVGLTHEDDEVVQGLRSIGGVKFNIFHKDFFVPVFTAMAVFALPITYLVVIFSPSAMTGITEYLKTDVYRYESSKSAVDEAKSLRDEVRGLRKQMKGSGLTLRGCLSGKDVGKPSAQITAEEAKAICERWQAARKRFRNLRKDQPGLQRTMRFEASYLDPETGRLQGDGHDRRVNSWLLFNLINDSTTKLFGLDPSSRALDQRFGSTDRRFKRILRLLIPALLVPLLFALSAVFVLFLVRHVGSFLSQFIAKALDRVTWRQIRRSALGNDTPSEVASDAMERPHWLDNSYTYLPSELAEKITDHSNAMATLSIGKFRNAISDLAFADARDGDVDIVSEYFTWKELVHSAYFDVPEFRKFVAFTIAQSDGFKPTAAFKADSDYARLEAWSRELVRKSPPLAAVGTTPSET